MNNEKQRLVLFFLLAIALMSGTRILLNSLGLMPPPRPRPQVAQPDNAIAKAGPAPAIAAQPVQNDVKAAPNGAGKPEAADQAGAQIAPAVANNQPVELVGTQELLLGSDTDKSPDGYRLAVQLDQRGAGITLVASSRYEADFLGKNPHLPLALVRQEGPELPSFAMTSVSLGAPAQTPDANAAADTSQPLSYRLDTEIWEVVRDNQSRVIKPVVKTDPRSGAEIAGQEVTFRTKVGDPAVVITKTYRLFKNEDGFEIVLGFESPAGDHSLVYQLLGPHGIPIEGESYTDTFRDVFFGQLGLEIKSRTAAEVVKSQADPKPLTASPLLFAGVENQYFAVFLEPDPLPTSDQDNRIKETVPVVILEDPKNPLKSDVSVKITSTELEVGPNRQVAHAFRVYAGPKRASNLVPYGAQQLAVYRKTGWFFIPFASTLAQTVISPLLNRMYGLTEVVASVFGGKRGNYGIAIILLTITVRLLMFPLSRKQAISAKKMQDLQPLMVELKEKYKDDKETLTKETFALYKKHGVNPMGGCVPALIQMPIFVGLWQTLRNSVELRHASFLWIQNLAAPDMIFRFPAPIPLLGSFLGDYFNLLPFLVVGLMLVQTKLFSPPPTTPEAEMQMKTMKFMMVFMAFMFYRVASGLGMYFITSSLWAIGERMLLPKIAAAHARPPQSEPRDEGPSGGKGGPSGGRGPSAGNGPPTGWLAQQKEKLEKLLEEAAKDGTVRNEPSKREPDRDRPRTRPGKRR
jgi:YidC/Oxa1 family membrane protein insertase